MTATLIISHGSRLQKTIKELEDLCDKIKSSSTISIVQYAFLEIASPNIPEGLDICVNRGASKIIVLLNFLNAGKHVDEDIPEIIEECRDKYPAVKIIISKPIGQHDRIAELFLDTIKDLS